MPWNDAKAQARYEIIFRERDRALHDFSEQRAAAAGMSMPEYMLTLARAVQLAAEGNPMLLSFLGVASLPHAAAAQVTPVVQAVSTPPALRSDPALLDLALDQLGM